eukprot:Platyproteum_vivax@DN17186_c0_g1_i1.p1
MSYIGGQNGNGSPVPQYRVPPQTLSPLSISEIQSSHPIPISTTAYPAAFEYVGGPVYQATYSTNPQSVSPTYFVSPIAPDSYGNLSRSPEGGGRRSIAKSKKKCGCC